LGQPPFFLSRAALKRTDLRVGVETVRSVEQAMMPAECVSAGTVAPAAIDAARVTSMAPLRCEVLHDFEACAAWRHQWDELVEAVRSDTYFTYDWCRIWWRHYGQGRALRILAFRAADELVGVVPLVLERSWVGPLPVRLARLAGSDSTLAVLRPAVRDEHAVAVFRETIKRALDEFQCEALSLARLSGVLSTSEDVRAACRELGGAVRILADRAVNTHVVFRLPASLAEYLQSLSTNERHQFRRCERRLGEAGAVATRYLRTPDELVEAIEGFAELHHKQWSHVGRLGHFGDWPDSLAFTRDLIRCFGPQGRVEIGEVRVDDRVVAMEFFLRLGRMANWRLRARDPDPEWEKRGVGRVAMLREWESMIAQGVEQIEAGSAFSYKLHVGGGEYPLTSILVARNQAWPLLKARLLLRYSELLDRVYYRRWYQRIAPHIPHALRPLWKTWIRTRI
jgi:CelD/BcsL family acetyltransferase involved in cellulose biosynthesis